MADQNKTSDNGFLGKLLIPLVVAVLVAALGWIFTNTFGKVPAMSEDIAVLKSKFESSVKSFDKFGSNLGTFDSQLKDLGQQVGELKGTVSMLKDIPNQLQEIKTDIGNIPKTANLHHKFSEVISVSGNKFRREGKSFTAFIEFSEGHKKNRIQDISPELLVGPQMAPLGFILDARLSASGYYLQISPSDSESAAMLGDFLQRPGSVLQIKVTFLVDK